jgi:hypothetical protein
MNGANTSSANQPNSNPSKQQFKTNSLGKSTDGARKQLASPVDAASRYVKHAVMIPIPTVL